MLLFMMQGGLQHLAVSVVLSLCPRSCRRFDQLINSLRLIVVQWLVVVSK